MLDGVMFHDGDIQFSYNLLLQKEFSGTQYVRHRMKV